MDSEYGFEYKSPGIPDNGQQEEIEWLEALHEAGFLTRWELLDSWQAKVERLEALEGYARGLVLFLQASPVATKRPDDTASDTAQE